MTPVPGIPFSSGFRHGDADAAHAQEQSKPIIIPTDPERIEKSLLPLKKRATSDSSDREGSSFLVPLPPKKRRVDAGSEGTSARVIPLRQSHLDLLYQTVTVAGTSASSPNATTSQRQKLTSGGDEQPLHVTRPRRPAACDGAYVSMEEDETAPAAKKKKKKKKDRNRDRKKKSRPARVAVPPPLHVSMGLTQHLEGLAATAPQFVCVKTLQSSDVNLNQNRLLFSCKRGSVERHPITGLLSDKETYYVHQWKDGLRVTAFDYHGNEFGFKLRYLSSNGAYRFIGDWGEFVKEHGLQIHVGVELWAFRSPSLPEQPKLSDEDKQRRLDGIQGHPDGALGLLLLFQVQHRDARNVHHAEEEKERAPRPVHETKRKASVRQEKLADADAHVSQNITAEDMVTGVGKEMADALMGLLMLRSICLRSKTSEARHTDIILQVQRTGTCGIF